jgi:hypothetical protein
MYFDFILIDLIGYLFYSNLTRYSQKFVLEGSRGTQKRKRKSGGRKREGWGEKNGGREKTEGRGKTRGKRRSLFRRKAKL